VVSVSVLLVGWSVICCQDGYFMVRQRHIPEEYLGHNLDEHCLDDTYLRRPQVGKKWGKFEKRDKEMT